MTTLDFSVGAYAGDDREQATHVEYGHPGEQVAVSDSITASSDTQVTRGSVTASGEARIAPDGASGTFTGSVQWAVAPSSLGGVSGGIHSNAYIVIPDGFYDDYWFNYDAAQATDNTRIEFDSWDTSELHGAGRIRSANSYVIDFSTWGGGDSTGNESHSFHWNLSLADQDLSLSGIDVSLRRRPTPLPLHDGSIVTLDDPLEISVTGGSLGDKRLRSFTLALYASLDRNIDIATDTKLWMKDINVDAQNSFTVTTFPKASTIVSAMHLSQQEYLGKPIYFGAVIDPGNGMHNDSNRANNVLIGPSIIVKSSRLATVTFGGDGFTPMRSDSGVLWNNNEWIDTDLDGDADDPVRGTQAAPVLYAAGAVPTVEATWRLSSNDILPSYVHPDLLRVRGHSQLFDVPDTMPIVDSRGVVTLDPLSVDRALGSAVAFYDDLAINWELSFDGGISWTDAGRSTNDFYVARPRSPLTTPMTMYHTVVDVAVRNAIGLTAPEAILAGIWADFADCKVFRADGSGPLTYWATFNAPGSYKGSFHTVEDLLRIGDGACDAWSRFFLATLDVHGLFSQFADASMLTLTPAQAEEAMLVKNWSFRGSGTSGEARYPYSATEFGQASTGVVAQGGNRPLVNIFDSHAVVRINGRVYDPSYGITYASTAVLVSNTPQGFAQQSLDGFQKMIPRKVRGPNGIEEHLVSVARRITPSDYVIVKSSIPANQLRR